MARTTSVTLGDHFEQFVEEQIKQGYFQTASEVIRAGLRSLEKEDRHERLLDRLDDMELAKIIEARKGQKEISVNFDDL